jgi:hypothetical protein
MTKGTPMRIPRYDPELPKCWERPTSDLQAYLFGDSTEDVLATLKVSRDDVKRWKAKGWVSFNIDEMDSLDWAYSHEIEFVRDVARSGLLDAQIDSLLEPLPKPYRFSPHDTAYSFVFGWVVPARDDPFEVIENNLDDWIGDLADRGDLDRLQQIADKIAEQIEALQTEEDTE